MKPRAKTLTAVGRKLTSGWLLRRESMRPPLCPICPSRVTLTLVEAHQKPVQRRPMRPSLLDPLFAALTTLPGVGPKLEKLYRKLLGREDTPARVIDLLIHLPTGTIDRRSRPKLRDVV